MSNEALPDIGAVAIVPPPPPPTVSLLDLPADSFAIVLAQLGVRPSLAELLRVAEVCSGFRATLSDESVWQTLCKYAWSVADADLSLDWPSLSSFRALYAVLQTWAPRQGFHQVLEAYPWGALLLLRFRGGRFVGELLHHAASAPRGGGKCVAQEPVTLLTVDFTSDGTHRSFDPSADVRWCGLRVASCSMLSSADAFASELLPGMAAYTALRARPIPHTVQCRQYLQLALEERGEAERGVSADEFRRLWQPTRPHTDAAAAEGERWLRRMRELPFAASLAGQNAQGGRGGGKVTLGLVDGPSLPPAGSDASAAARPGLRPGMYIGDYSHNSQYGLYGNEALLLECRDFELGGDCEALRCLFGRGSLDALSAHAARFIHMLRAALLSPGDDGEAADPARARCTLLIGRKITGDMHVPMGAATFVACLEPPAGRHALDGYLGGMPARILTRGGEESVVRGWSGFGTLAFPGFGRPQWDPGWLVQLEDDGDGRRFAFVWGSRQSDSANMLTQVVAQSNAVFVGGNEALRPY